MDYTLETATRLADGLRAMPAKDPSQRRLDKQAMVKHLSGEITALRERGYGRRWAQVVWKWSVSTAKTKTASWALTPNWPIPLSFSWWAL
jgi:hypothetical protein